MKSNILIDELPKTVNVNGKEYDIAWDFRTSVLFELLMCDPEYSDEEKIAYALELYYGDTIPGDVEAAISAIVAFYACGETEQENAGGNSKAHKKLYSFEQDAPYIYAAFRGQYGIELNAVEGLHWWAFSAMFCSLDENNRISKIMYYRDADLKGRSKAEKSFLQSMKKKYALKEQRQPQHQLTLAQRNASMRAYVKRRFEEVESRR